MSTDPYPDVSGDESGIVPPQGARSSEWPKKLRTLTAAELDRLTIDSSGRFYWDGKLVNYGTESTQVTEKSPDSLDHSMDILDRASYELGSHKSLATIEGELAPVDAPGHDRDSDTADLDVGHTQAAAAMPDSSPAPQAIRSERTRLTLSLWQTIGAVVVALAVVVGAIGMATYGYVAARDWGCKMSTTQDGCPALYAPPVRHDIPA